MKRIIRLSNIGLLFISSINVSVINACTIFTVSHGETVMFGGTEIGLLRLSTQLFMISKSFVYIYVTIDSMINLIC
jgi:hypothetical protein